MEVSDRSICEPEGLSLALDHDIIFCCVDSPWARTVLNVLAYSDLIPVIDGGMSIDTFLDGRMRNATWRSHVVRPQRPCMSCNGQLDLAKAALEMQRLLENPRYIVGADMPEGSRNQNVAPLSISGAAGLLAQYVSFSVAPAGLGDPGPLQYWLSSHCLEHICPETKPFCPVEQEEGVGDLRTSATSPSGTNRPSGSATSLRHPEQKIHLMRWADDAAQAVSRWFDRLTA